MERIVTLKVKNLIEYLLIIKLIKNKTLSRVIFVRS